MFLQLSEREKKNPNILKMSTKAAERRRRRTTNPEVAGCPQEHTSFPDLEETTAIFHSPWHTCPVSSPTLGGECLICVYGPF